MLLDAMECWEWNVPPGLGREQVNRASIKWKKDGFSHFCEAAGYTVLVRSTDAYLVILYETGGRGHITETSPAKLTVLLGRWQNGEERALAVGLSDTET